MIVEINGQEYDVDWTYISGVPAKMAFGEVMEHAEPGYYDFRSIKQNINGEWKEIVPSDEMIEELEKELEDFL